MKLSVVIPTYNRALILKTCLERLSAQKGVDFEVIVVDDGSTDDTGEVVKGFVGEGEMKVIYIKQKNALQAAARNRGVREATGELILFIGDDIFPEPGMLKTHVQAHEKNGGEEAVVLGFSTWDPTLKITEYMAFLDRSGWQFRYHALTPGRLNMAHPYKYFYTSNLSMKRSFFEREQFDERFKVYGSEDIELGYRLWKDQGMELFYEPKAVAHHHHVLTEDDLPKKMESIGQSVVHYQRKHPESGAIPRGPKAWLVKVAIFPLFYPVLLFVGKVLSRDFYFQLKSRKAFWSGVRRGQNA